MLTVSGAFTVHANKVTNTLTICQHLFQDLSKILEALVYGYQTTDNVSVVKWSEEMPTRKPRIMFQTDEPTKEALERWAEDEGKTVSNLIDTALKELLLEIGYLEPPKKLLKIKSDRQT